MVPIPAPPPDVAQDLVPACMVQAARDYSLPLRGLIAVWLTESGSGEPLKSLNKNGTVDHGPFQINTAWANRLQSEFGVAPELITSDFCWAARAGAYILRYEINQAGGSFWDGVGHYHSRTPKFKYPYIQRVYNNSLRF
ncbi:lytic transglycosylase domain-containing protein [Pseudomonas sp. NBRC 111127]|uniref:lytic transglycosylase domain-containing protein n=1 Tax=Pseudomonas sp. NBRC 111127 TaxID=1661042 RepID=UPI0006D3DE80|nr:lytic transglycosylase domain-containing protein [Pseudomonas sp. NBRC 111127]